MKKLLTLLKNWFSNNKPDPQEIQNTTITRTQTGYNVESKNKVYIGTMFFEHLNGSVNTVDVARDLTVLFRDEHIQEEALFTILCVLVNKIREDAIGEDKELLQIEKVRMN